MEKNSKVPEVIFLCLVIALAVAVVFLSRDFELRAFLLPLVGAIPAALLAAYQLARLALGKPSDSDAGGTIDYGARPAGYVEDDADVDVDGKEGSIASTTTTTTATTEPLAPHWWAFAWLAVLTVLVYVLGLLLGSLVFAGLYMRLRAGDPVKRIILVVGLTGAVFLLLVNFLGAPIYRGLLF